MVLLLASSHYLSLVKEVFPDERMMLAKLVLVEGGVVGEVVDGVTVFCNGEWIRT